MMRVYLDRMKLNTMVEVTHRVLSNKHRIRFSYYRGSNIPHKHYRSSSSFDTILESNITMYGLRKQTKTYYGNWKK